jgi:hypothetical protein
LFLWAYYFLVFVPMGISMKKKLAGENWEGLEGDQ